MALLSSQTDAAGERVAAQSPAVALCETSAGLQAIAKPAAELVIWRRTLPLCLGAWLEGLAAGHLPNLRVLLDPKEVGQALPPLLDADGVPSGDRMGAADSRRARLKRAERLSGSARAAPGPRCGGLQGDVRRPRQRHCPPLAGNRRQRRNAPPPLPQHTFGRLA